MLTILLLDLLLLVNLALNTDSLLVEFVDFVALTQFRLGEDALRLRLALFDDSFALVEPLLHVLVVQFAGKLEQLAGRRRVVLVGGKTALELGRRQFGPVHRQVFA